MANRLFAATSMALLLSTTSYPGFALLSANLAIAAPTTTVQGYVPSADDHYGSNIIGKHVYSSPAADAEDFGAIKDFLVDKSGRVRVVVVGVGGFLGIGEKNVALDYSQLQWTAAADGSLRAIVNTTKDALSGTPDFNFTDSLVAGNAQPAKVAQPQATAAQTPSPVSTDGANIASFKSIDAGSLKSSDLKGIDVIGPDGRKLAEIDDFVLTSAGKVDAVLVDFGGFLGVGKKEVAIAFDGLKFLSDQNNKRYLQVNVTRDQLDAQRPYNKDDFTANRTAERLVVGNAPSNNVTPAPAQATATAPAEGLDMSTLKPIDAGSLKSSDLKDIDVIGPDGSKLAEINDFVLTSGGQVDAVLVDFGGFLGIGKKEVAIAFEGLKFLADNNNKRYLQVNVTKDQLDAQRGYNKDDYAANRVAERLVVGTSANGVSSKTPAITAATSDPAQFAAQAGASNYYEIATSQLALTKSQNPDVKAFAQKMIDDHTKAAADLAAAASTQGIAPPAAPDTKQQGDINRMNGLAGGAFDSAYGAAQAKAHADAIALFQGYSSTGPVGALKDFAFKALPTLQMHSDMAKKLPR